MSSEPFLLPALAEDLAEAARELTADELGPEDGRRRSGRLSVDPEDASRGLAQLVLTVVELLRQVMERQAIRRMESGSLTDEQVDRLGETFMRLAERMDELKEHFGLDDDDLNLDLGPLGRLL